MRKAVDCSQVTDYLRSWVCSRRGVVQRDGKWYCKQHDPEAVKARRKASNAAWEAKLKAEDEADKRADRIASAERRVIEAAKYLGDIDGSHLEEHEPLRRLLDATRDLVEAEATK